MARDWEGKHKALTFSFDDGVTQDRRLVEILNAYGLKATFNLNSSLLGLPNRLVRNGHDISHDKNTAELAPEIYRGHEVAVHTLTHPMLPELDDATVTWQVEEDRRALSSLFGYDVVGMAYPGGGVNNDARVAKAIGETTGVRYARTITSSYSFAHQKNLMQFNPTVYYIEVEKLFSLGREFLSLETEEDAVFYVWGHSYEMDAEYISWKKFEDFCREISGKNDIYYCTNREALLHMPPPPVR